MIRPRDDPAAQWNDLADNAGWGGRQHTGDFVSTPLGEFSGIAPGVAIIAILLTSPLIITGEPLMSLYQAMVNRFVFVTPVIAAHEARGRAKGRAEGRAAECAEWQE